MKISIMIEGQMGLNWARWKRAAAEVESLGFHGLYRSDHFTNASGAFEDALDLIPSLTYLATATTRLRFGQLVSPVSFRDPVLLTRQMSAIADLSGGRLTYGLGAGWQQREHDTFGYDLGTIPTRMARLQEGLEVATLLLRSDEPVSFQGRFFQLTDAPTLPRPSVDIPLCVGGNGLIRTLPLAARFADVWNAIYCTPDAYAERCARLDELLEMIGRKPTDVRRTMMTGYSADPSALDRGALAGSPEQVRDRLAALAATGCDEVMIQWLKLDDIDLLHTIAEATL